MDEKAAEYSWAERLGLLLKERGYTLTTAESCTAGGIGAAIASVPGSSSYFKGGVISYFTEVKERLLGVKHDTVERFGVVSRETVYEMAAGVAKLLGADCALSVSGVAGPGRGDDDPEVGTIWLGAYVAGRFAAKKIEKDFGSRHANMENAVHEALQLMCRLLDSAILTAVANGE